MLFSFWFLFCFLLHSSFRSGGFFANPSDDCPPLQPLGSARRRRWKILPLHGKSLFYMGIPSFPSCEEELREFPSVFRDLSPRFPGRADSRRTPLPAPAETDLRGAASGPAAPARCCSLTASPGCLRRLAAGERRRAPRPRPGLLRRWPPAALRRGSRHRRPAAAPSRREGLPVGRPPSWRGQGWALATSRLPWPLATVAAWLCRGAGCCAEEWPQASEGLGAGLPAIAPWSLPQVK